MILLTNAQISICKREHRPGFCVYVNDVYCRPNWTSVNGSGNKGPRCVCVCVCVCVFVRKHGPTHNPQVPWVHVSLPENLVKLWVWDKSAKTQHSNIYYK